jgi:hypothetical protein
MSQQQETEVFRLRKLVPGKYYETAEYTRKTGSYGMQNEKYYTTNPLRYVGKYVKTERVGWGDGGRGWEIFEKDGQKIEVEYTYEGTTCFREVEEPFEYVLK